MRFRFLTVLMLLIMPVMAHAADVGDAIPHQFELVDQSGHEQNFDKLKGEKGLVVAFIRSADWCPYCQIQLLDLQAGSPLITQYGYNIATVSYDDVEVLERFTKKHDFAIPMLSDGDTAAIRAFDILDESKKEGSRAYGIPHPTVYIVGADGHIEHILAEGGFKKRPSAEAIAAAISGN